MGSEIIGWAAAAVLLATLGRQVYSQWRDGAWRGVSRWLFLGQVSASLGFILYSWLLRDWVFVVTNALILLTALAGQWIYLRNKKRSAFSRDPSSDHGPLTCSSRAMGRRR